MNIKVGDVFTMGINNARFVVEELKEITRLNGECEQLIIGEVFYKGKKQKEEIFKQTFEHLKIREK